MKSIRKHTLLMSSVSSFLKGKFYFLKEEGVEVVYLPRTPEISTSQIKHDLYDANGADGESQTPHDDIDTDPCV